MVRNNGRAGHRPGRGGTQYVSASELAQMGACERKVVLDRRHGRQLSKAQRQAVERGLRLHAVFLEQAGAPGDGRGGRCFIATLVYGADAPQTRALRRYRDEVLRHHAIGRLSIRWYYRAAPGMCSWLSRHPWASTCVRACLRAPVAYARWRCHRAEVHHGR